MTKKSVSKIVKLSDLYNKQIQKFMRVNIIYQKINDEC